MSVVDNRTFNYFKKASPNYCVIVGAHLRENKEETNVSPLDLLILCINSLTTQFVPVAIYLSISFETPELKAEFRRRIIRSNHLTIITSTRKKTTLRHISDIVDGMVDDTFDRQHKFVMFCEPTDNYNQYRTVTHIERTTNILTPEGKKFAGLIEMKEDENLMQEYWRYCVDIKLVRQFFARLSSSKGGNGELIDFPQGDCLFALYLRQLEAKYLFLRINKTMVTNRERFDLDDTFSESPNLKYAQENLYLYLLMGGNKNKAHIRNFIAGFKENGDKLKLYKFRHTVERMIHFICDLSLD